MLYEVITSSQADFQARNIVSEGLKTRFTVWHLGEKLGEILLNLPGTHT